MTYDSYDRFMRQCFPKRWDRMLHSQDWREWQADRDIAEGRTARFDTIDALLADLDR